MVPGGASDGGLRHLGGGPTGPHGQPGDLLALASSIGAAAALERVSGTFVAGVALAHLSFWLDHVDGQVARWRGTASLDGVYFDYMMHNAASIGWDSPSATAWRRSDRATRGGRLRGSRWPWAGPCSACTTTAATRHFFSGSKHEGELPGRRGAGAAVRRRPPGRAGAGRRRPGPHIRRARVTSS